MLELRVSQNIFAFFLFTLFINFSILVKLLLYENALKFCNIIFIMKI